MRFAFKGVAYQYKVPPFGLSLAPHTFTQCMDVALSTLAQSEAVSTSYKSLLLSHLCRLGLRVNFAKSILSPSQRVSFLGTVIDSVQMTATVLAERATTIERQAASFKEGNTHPRKAFQKMLGLMAVALPVLQLALLHMRPIQFWLK